MVLVPREEDLDTDVTKCPIFQKFPDLFLQSIIEGDFMLEDGQVRQVRIFEGFEGTLQDIITAKNGEVEIGEANQLNVNRLRNEHLAVMLIDLYEKLQEGDETAGLRDYFCLHASQIVLVRGDRQYKIKMLPFEQPFWGHALTKAKHYREVRDLTHSAEISTKMDKMLDKFIFEECMTK